MANTTVGIVDMALANAPDTLTTIGLGSCVGIVLYDQVRKTGGLSHVLLPQAPAQKEVQAAKYANTAIAELIRRMGEAGASPRRLIAKLAGGASLFMGGAADFLQIGRLNVAMCRETLQAHRIPIVAEDTGGNMGRTIVFDCETGLLRISTAWPQSEKWI